MTSFLFCLHIKRVTKIYLVKEAYADKYEQSYLNKLLFPTISLFRNTAKIILK